MDWILHEGRLYKYSYETATQYVMRHHLGTATSHAEYRFKKDTLKLIGAGSYQRGEEISDQRAQSLILHMKAKAFKEKVLATLSDRIRTNTLDLTPARANELSQEFGLGIDPAKFGISFT